MIEAAVCLFLIALGLGVWAFAALCRRIYSRPRPPGSRADDSFLARIFTPEPSPVLVNNEPRPAEPGERPGN